MEQIYYTQCPIGYGLGASNGFQVKRISPGYPQSGDFRHLGLRAYAPGSRALAPATLRYRRVGDAAEVARLTPRASEYETERGPWGRPGGHFAHGLVLDRAELVAIGDWPAGLLDAPCWRTSDPEPTRGRPPADLAMEPVVPSLSALAPIAAEVGPDRLAGLLAATAAVAREGRTLFLIDRADRLGPTIALVTALFPPPLRLALTFSTYHDRPEDLPGYRIQGVSPEARPNRGALLALGIVADGATGTIEPRADPPAWARSVAAWAVEGSEADWASFRDRVARAEGSPGFDPWSDAWLDRAVGFDQALRGRSGEVDWPEEAETMAWAVASGNEAEWAAARGPAWWESADVGTGTGRPVLRALVARPVSWSPALAEGWGRAFARWYGGVGVGAREREAAAVDFVAGAGDDADRLAFVRALGRSLSVDQAGAIRMRLAEAFRSRPGFVALMGLADAVARARAGDPLPLRESARRVPSAMKFLDAVAAEVDGRPDAMARVGESLADLLDTPEGLGWALARGDDDATAWLRGRLRRRLAEGDDLRPVFDAVPEGSRPRLATVLLRLAADLGMPDEAFVGVVGRFLLPIPEPDRPTGPAWPGLYLDRSPSDRALIDGLFARGRRVPGLREWLDRGARLGHLSSAHLARLDHLKALARALSARGPDEAGDVDFARVPPGDRAPILAGLLRRDSQAGADPSATLARLGRAWPESLRPGSVELPAIARAVAESDLLASRGDDPGAWFGCLEWICETMGAPAPDEVGPDGLVALTVARVDRSRGQTAETWALRGHLLAIESAWRALGADLRLDLDARAPGEAPEVVDAWDRALPKPSPARFWELVLNACDGPRLFEVVTARTPDLSTLGPLPWWDHGRHPGARDDLRDAFARLAPIRPILGDRLVAVSDWIGKTTVTLSDRARGRWLCIEGLSVGVFRDGLDDQTRRTHVRDWRGRLPLEALSEDDLHRFLAWVLLGIADPSAFDHDRLAALFVGAGLADVDRVARWPDELAGLADVPDATIDDRREVVRDIRHALFKERKDRLV